MMRLSDIVSKMGASFYIEVALVLFFAVFLGVLFYAYGLLRNDAVEHMAAMPLDDDPPVSSDAPSSNRSSTHDAPSAG